MRTKLKILIGGVLLALLFLVPTVGAQDVRRSLTQVTRMLFGDGTVTLPAIAFKSAPTVGWYKNGTGLYYTDGASNIFAFDSSTQAFSVTVGGQIGFSSTSAGANDTILSRDAANTLALKNGTNNQIFRVYKSTTGPTYTAITGDGLSFGIAPVISVTQPTVTSGFGSSVAGTIVSGSTAFNFRITVGTNAGGVTGVIGLPTATTFWNCRLADQTTPADITNQTASTVSAATFTATVAWTTGDVLIGGCTGS